MGQFENLTVWKRGHDLTLAIYVASRSFPNEEKFGLVSQMRRASASIPANIAEGCGRKRDPELARFVEIAIGSSNELEYHLRLARDLNYLDDAAYVSLLQRTQEVGRMLSSLLVTVRKKRPDLR
jgi:four helix bundle protein